MAKTYNKINLCVRMPENSFLSYATRRLPEGASQTFIAGAPVVIASGLVVEAASPITDVFAVAVRAGQNAASGKVSEVLPIIDGVEFYANLLNTNGTDYVMVANDLNVNSQQVLKGAFGAGSATIWFLGRSGSTVGGKVVSLESDISPANTPAPDDTFAAVGDTNARVSAIFLAAVRSYK